MPFESRNMSVKINITRSQKCNSYIQQQHTSENQRIFFCLHVLTIKPFVFVLLSPLQVEDEIL